jgi:hypothetical protein
MFNSDSTAPLPQKYSSTGEGEAGGTKGKSWWQPEEEEQEELAAETIAGTKLGEEVAAFYAEDQLGMRACKEALNPGSCWP